VPATSAPPSVTWVELPDEIRLYVEEYGDPSADLTVVLLHGWTLDARLWHRQVADLPARLGSPLRIVTFDLRGHGNSTACPRDATTLFRLADDLAEVLRARVPTGRVVLAGHSMGGMTIMEYAHRHPEDFAERVAGVVLVATSAEGTLHTTYGVPTALARVIRRVEQAGLAVLARSGPWRPHRPVMPVLAPGLRWFGFGDSADPEAVRLTADMIGSARLTAIGGFRPWIDLHNRVDALEAMRALPAAVLVGARDRLTPLSCAETIARALPDAEHVVCPQAGHMLPLECPDEVSDAIVRVCRQATGAVPKPVGVRARIGAMASRISGRARARQRRPSA
jgi:pimeloyl-ACP methyl ester carboxylesterase